MQDDTKKYQHGNQNMGFMGQIGLNMGQNMGFMGFMGFMDFMGRVDTLISHKNNKKLKRPPLGFPSFLAK